MAKVQSMSKSGSHRKLEKSRLDPNPGSTLSGGVGFQPLPIDSRIIRIIACVVAVSLSRGNGVLLNLSRPGFPT
jgi:hypothetical protein